MSLAQVKQEVTINVYQPTSLWVRHLWALYKQIHTSPVTSFGQLKMIKLENRRPLKKKKTMPTLMMQIFLRHLCTINYEVKLIFCLKFSTFIFSSIFSPDQTSLSSGSSPKLCQPSRIDFSTLHLTIFCHHITRILMFSAVCLVPCMISGT